jgi:thiamine pyrophosphate-dependent acetolactate synthase large subunit-like protein
MDFGRIDNVLMAKSCGVDALRTADPGELAAAVRAAIEQGKSLVAAVPVHYADYRKLF